MRYHGAFISPQLWLFVAFFCCFQLVRGQPTRFAFNHLSNRQGLINDYNWFVSQDSRGLIWVSSTRGLNRFDGKNIRSWRPAIGNPAEDSCRLTGEFVLSPMFESPNGDLWFSTYDAVNCYRYREDCLQPFYPPGCRPDAPPCENYAFGMDGAGKLWGVRADESLWSLDTRNGQFSTIYSSSFDKGIPLFDKKKKLAAVLLLDRSEDGELLRFENDQPVDAKPLQLKMDGTRRFTIRNAWFQSVDSLWLCGPAGLALHSPQTGKTSFFSSEKDINSVIPWLQQFLLCASQDRGLLVFDIKKQVFVHRFHHDPNDPNSLSTDNLANVFVDESDGLWVSGFSGNVDFARAEKSRFSDFFETDARHVPGKGEDLFVKQLFEDASEKIWVGYKHGLICLDPETGKPTRPFARLGQGSANVTYFLKDCDRFPWFMDVSGVWQMHTFTGKPQQVATPTDHKHFFTGGVCLANGSLLLGNNKGVWAMEKKASQTWNLSQTPEFDAHSSWSALFLDKRGRLFVNRDQSSIELFENRNGIWHPLKSFPKTGAVNDWAETPGAVWFGNSRGLNCIDSSTLKLHYFDCKSCATTLAVQSILPESNAVFWLGTSNGLMTFDLKTGHFRKFSLAEELSDSRFLEGTALRTRGGNLFLAIGSKIIRIGKDEASPEKNVAVPVITQIRLNDAIDSLLRCDKTGARNALDIQKIVVPFSKNNLTLDLAALEFRNPAMNRLRYRLLDEDERWIEIDGHFSLRIPQMQQGEYVFELQAAGANGRWSATRQLEIRVLPPWWQTWWFRILVGAVVFSIIYGFYRNRVRRILWQETVRRNLARDLHDEVGSSLSAIEMFSRIAKNDHESTETGQSFEKIRGIAAQSQAAMRDLIWVLDSRLDTLGDAIGHMRDFAGPLAERQQVKLDFVHEKSLDSLGLKPKIRRNLYYIFREAINNSLKYADCTAIEVHFSFRNDRLHMTIFDNGKGFDLQSAHLGEGQRNMARRAEDIEAKWKVKTAPGNGTRLFLEVKIA